MAVFGSQPYKRSSALARGFPDSTREGSATDAEGERHCMESRMERVLERRRLAERSGEL